MSVFCFPRFHIQLSFSLNNSTKSNIVKPTRRLQCRSRYLPTEENREGVFQIPVTAKSLVSNDDRILPTFISRENKMESQSIPVIDFGPLLAKCEDQNMWEDAGVIEVVRQLDQACREAGFFYVKGHGIPETLMKRARDITRTFFELPLQEKLKIKLTSAAGHRGYQKIGQNITKEILDLQEAIDYYKEFEAGAYGDIGKAVEGLNQWPMSPPEFKDVMEEYISLCTDLSKKMLKGIALALGGSPYELERKVVGDDFWVMRLIGYPGTSQKNKIGCGPHTDYGLLTLINQDDHIPALEVKSLQGEWKSVASVPGCFICNIGDMLQILSNGIYGSTLHRVINKTSDYRVSVAYFYEPNFDAVVEPLEICKGKEGNNSLKVQRAIYGEHLVAKVLNNFVNL